MEIEEKNEQEKLAPIKKVLKRPLVILFTIILCAFFLHPKLLNIHMYFKSRPNPIPMNFVSNFYLWSRRNPNDPEILVAGENSEQIENAKFGFRKTYVLIHGFTRHGLAEWIIHLKTALLWRENCNVISVDWEAGSVTMGYYVIQERVPLVGQDIGRFLTFLNQQGGLSFQDVHLIGHSLGAHIAGYTGKFLNETIPRITGLDPASLGYNGVGMNSRLDKSDASFVDVIHTHGCYTIVNQWNDCFGTYDNIGDADFWPNGGETQPACEEDGDGMRHIPEGSNCHHGMAHVYYTQSIWDFSTSTRFLARRCDSWDNFNNKSCPCEYPPQYLGYNVNPSLRGVFYLNTSRTEPYGLLDPYCSPAQYSLFRILGIGACLVLIISALLKSSLSVARTCGYSDQVDALKILVMKVSNQTKEQ